MNLKKNDIVESLEEFPVQYSNVRKVAKGTVGTVYKVNRKDGTILVGFREPTGNEYVTSTPEKFARKETPMHSVNAGDVFYCSWGYEQTNISYFQINSVKGNKISYHEIRAEKTYDGIMCGHCIPIKDDAAATKNAVLRVTVDGSASFKAFSFAYAYRWSGKNPDFFSEWH